MSKKSILILTIILIAAFVLLKSCPDPFADRLAKNQIFKLVIQNEDLLRTVSEEIQGLPNDIFSISTTEKMKIYESEYEHIKGL